MNVSDYSRERRTLDVFGKGRKWRTLPVPEAVCDFVEHALEERLTPWRGKEDAMFVSQKAAVWQCAPFNRSLQKRSNDSSKIRVWNAGRLIPAIS